MNKGNKKKRWVRPKLIVLVRGKPEERCLSLCKVAGRPYVEIYNSNGECYGVTRHDMVTCVQCSTPIGT